MIAPVSSHSPRPSSRRPTRSNSPSLSRRHVSPTDAPPFLRTNSLPNHLSSRGGSDSPTATAATRPPSPNPSEPPPTYSPPSPKASLPRSSSSSSFTRGNDLTNSDSPSSRSASPHHASRPHFAESAHYLNYLAKLDYSNTPSIAPDQIASTIAPHLSAATTRHSDPDTQEDVKQRLEARIRHLRAIQTKFTSGNSFELVGFIGWGRDCQFNIDQMPGISETHAVVFRHNGQVYVETLGSAISVFKRPLKPDLASLDAIALSTDSHQSAASATATKPTIVQTHFHEIVSPMTDGGRVYSPTTTTVFLTDLCGLYASQPPEEGGGVSDSPTRTPFVVLPLSDYTLTRYDYTDQAQMISGQAIPLPELPDGCAFRWVTKGFVGVDPHGNAIKGCWVLEPKINDSSADDSLVADPPSPTWSEMTLGQTIPSDAKPQWIGGVMCQQTCAKAIYDANVPQSTTDASAAVLFDLHLMHPDASRPMSAISDENKKRGIGWGLTTVPEKFRLLGQSPASAALLSADPA